MATENVNIQLLIDAGNSPKTLGDIKKNVVDIKNALLDTKVGTEEFKKLQSVLVDNQKALRNIKKEFDTLANIGTFVKTISGAFGVATAAISLFGVENEVVNESLQKTQAALTLVTSITALADGLKNAAEANSLLNASLLTNPYVLLTAVIVGAASALLIFTNNTKNADFSTDKFTKALNGNTEAAKRAKEQFDKNSAGMLEFLGILSTNIATGQSLTTAMNNARESVRGLRQAAFDYYTLQEQNKENIKFQEEVAKQEEKFNKTKANSLSFLEQKERERLDKQNEYLRKNISDLQAAGAVESQIKAAQIKLAEKQLQDEINIRNKFQDKLDALQAKTSKNAPTGAVIDNSFENAVLRATEFLKNYQTELEKARQNYIKNQNDTTKNTLDSAQRRYDEQVKYIDELIEKNNIAAKYNENVTNAQIKLDELKNNKTVLANKEANEKQKNSNEDLKNSTLKQLSEIAEKRKILEQDRNNELALLQAQGKGEGELLQKKMENASQSVKDIQLEIKFNQEAALKLKEKGIAYDEITKKISSLNEEIKGVFSTIDIELAKEQDKLKKQFEEVQAGISKQLQDKLQTDLQLVQTYIQLIGEVVSKTGDVITQSVQEQTRQRIELYQAEANAANDILEERLKQDAITQLEYDTQKEANDRNLRRKLAKERKKEFAANKAVAIANATISTALAVVNALATAPNFIAGIVFAALAAAAGAASIAVIAKTRPPQELKKGGIFNNEFAGGGEVKGQGTGTSDSINAKLSNGESVINAKGTAAFAPLLSAMNELTGGVKFANQPSVINNPAGIVPNTTNDNIQYANISVSISEEEVTRVQNKAIRIKNRSTL